MRSIAAILEGRSVLSLYEGLGQCWEGLAASSSACLHSSALAHAGTTSQATKAAEQTRNRRKYKPEVLEYFAEVKAWKKQMNVLKDEWRTEIVLKHRTAEDAKRQALQISKNTLQGASEAHQVKLALDDELRKAELELELAEIKLGRAQRFEKREADLERRQHKRRAALLEASRSWVARDQLLNRIHSALDNPMPFGFVEPLADAKRTL